MVYGTCYAGIANERMAPNAAIAPGVASMHFQYEYIKKNEIIKLRA